MATIGKLDKTSTIVETIVTADDHEDKNYGMTWAKNALGGNWVLCSTDSEVPPKNIIGAIGYKYDKTKDIFIPPQPYESWTFNQDTSTWEPPVALPAETEADKKTLWEWDETTRQWQDISNKIGE